MARCPSTLPTMRGAVPLLGHLPQLHWRALESLRAAKREFGPLFWVEQGFRNPRIYVADARGLEVLQHPQLSSAHLRDDEGMLGRSMMTVDGREHARMRNSAARSFSPAGISAAGITSSVVDIIRSHARTWLERGTLRVHEQTRSITFELIFRMLGVGAQDLPAWDHWYRELGLSMVSFGPSFWGSPAWRSRRARAWLEAQFRRRIQAARAREDRTSLFGMMVHGHDEQGEGASEQELLDNFILLVFGGHDTTAAAMAWALLHLAHSPSHWRRLVAEAEVLDTIPSNPRELLGRAPFALALLRESARMYPPAHTCSRIVPRELELFGLALQPGTKLAVSLTLLSRDRGSYVDPDRWRPERWLDRDRKPSALEKCQFGGGRHFCLGYHLALVVGVTTLIQLARELERAGKTLRPSGALPAPRFLPMTHPPAGTSLALVPQS